MAPRPRKEPEVREPSKDGGNGQNPEFDRFKGLARKLVKVPKKELDEKRKGV